MNNNNIVDKKIDFMLILNVKGANPNGDPLNEGRPRTDSNDFGIISDVCLKRKIRNRLIENGHNIIMQSNDNLKNVKERIETTLGKGLDTDTLRQKILETYLDARAFGALVLIPNTKKGKKKTTEDSEKDESTKTENISISGPITINSATSISQVDIIETQITKSYNMSEDNGKESSSMGKKFTIKDSTYVTWGSINPIMSEKTGLTSNDVQYIKDVLPKLFQNDSSCARPDGTMAVINVLWFEHSSKYGDCSTRTLQNAIKVSEDGTFTIDYSISPNAENILKHVEIIKGW